MTITKAAARRARCKVVGSLAATHGYAILGAPIIQPLLTGQLKFTAVQVAAVIIGVAIQSFAIYIAPYGEPS
jgi:hypothetical protein